MVQPTDPIHSLPGCPAGRFFGREDILDPLTRRLGVDGIAPEAISIEGPTGAGKSETIRRLGGLLLDREASVLPVYLDLAACACDRDERTAWRSLIRSAIFQILRLRMNRAGNDPGLPTEDPARLSGMCYGAGCAPLAAVLAGDVADGPASWPALLRAVANVSLAPIVWLIDGTTGDDLPGGPHWLRTLVRGVIDAGGRVVFESPAAGEPPIAECDLLTLDPLTIDEALALACSIGDQRGLRLTHAWTAPILKRLGPWPGLVRQWAGLVRSCPPGGNPQRTAEEAYMELIADSAWARRLERRFARAVALPHREAALRLVLLACEPSGPIAPTQAIALLGGDASDTESIMRHLTRLGLFEYKGLRWESTRTGVFADWANLTLAGALEPAGAEAARMRMFGRLLEQSRSAGEEQESDWSPGMPALSEVLGRFNGQTLPEALFNYEDYHEAFGRLTPEQRCEAVLNASATLRAPEVIGVARWIGSGRDAVEEAVVYAQAYREGFYEANREELWVVADLSAIRSLTTGEIETFRKIAHAVERRFGVPRVVPWVILGPTVSPQALERIRREKIYSSDAEQLRLIAQMTMPAKRREPIGTPPEAESPPPPPRRPVIEMHPPGEDPTHRQVSGLHLPAQADSELIAAVMAEKIAIRGGFDAAAAGRIKTAVLEGVLNAIEHSPNPEKTIDIEFTLDRDRLEIVVINEGSPFESPDAEPPDPRAKLDAFRKRGWGISLMKRFMDEAVYEPRRGGTRLRMVKLRRQPDNQVEVPTSQAKRGKA